ncbi:hypothetical protein WR25_17632 [Diploscapter pachys]|uniref:Uncharacterized protein n=1 Tax=Diploscapter pachys TaxID=2018661 RepID=A0A2A2K777_9BILA|nr:hypothetical protein WR25_17632 [Diploscapter pachys]
MPCWLLLPLRVSVPAPPLIRPPVPLSAPLRVLALPRVRLAPPFLIRLPTPETTPDRPRSAEPATVRAPLRLKALPRVTAVLLSRVVPLAVLTVPLVLPPFQVPVPPSITPLGTLCAPSQNCTVPLAPPTSRLI